MPSPTTAWKPTTARPITTTTSATWSTASWPTAKCRTISTTCTTNWLKPKSSKRRGSHLLQEIHSDGRYTYIYTEPDGYEPLAQVHNWTNEEGETYQETWYFHCDHIGIPREMTDKDGNLLWFGNYTGWGRLKEETTVTDSAYQPFRLQNQYADRETGLHHNFFRYYEPNVGRFMSQDLIGLWGGDNLYTLALISING